MCRRCILKFSAQEEYGLRCLLQIARKGAGGSLTIPEIARLEGVTSPHAAKILMVLRKEGFITSTRGQSGGYTIARAPEEIVVGDVLAALGGKLYDDGFCVRHVGEDETCRHAVNCSVRSLWEQVQEAVDSVVGRMTLADLMREENRPNVTIFAEPLRRGTV